MNAHLLQAFENVTGGVGSDDRSLDLQRHEQIAAVSLWRRRAAPGKPQ